MNKKLLGLAILATVFASNTHAQNAKEVTTNLKKLSVPAFQEQYDVSEDLMDETLKEKFKKAGFSKPRKKSGYCKYEGVILPEISPNKLDLYTKVDGNKSKATVTMLVSTGYDNYVNTAKDPVVAANAIVFLNKLKDDAAEMQAAIDLAAQQKALKKAKEKLEDSDREKAKLAKQKADLDKKMEAERKTQEAAAQKVEREKIRLENLKKVGE